MTTGPDQLIIGFPAGRGSIFGSIHAVNQYWLGFLHEVYFAMIWTAKASAATRGSLAQHCLAELPTQGTPRGGEVGI